MNLHEFLIVCPLVFLAGFVDAIAGGGGLISLPAYMFAGIPVHHAIATNKLSSATGTAVSTWHLVKSKCVDIFLVPGTVACAFVGSIAGANLALTKYLRRYWYLCFLLLHSVYCGTRI